MSDGLLYISKLVMDKNFHPEANAQAIPEYRAFERIKWIDKCSEDIAKKILDEEYYYQKNRDEYTGFKWW